MILHDAIKTIKNKVFPFSLKKEKKKILTKSCFFFKKTKKRFFKKTTTKKHKVGCFFLKKTGFSQPCNRHQQISKFYSFTLGRKVTDMQE